MEEPSGCCGDTRRKQRRARRKRSTPYRHVAEREKGSVVQRENGHVAEREKGDRLCARGHNEAVDIDLCCTACGNFYETPQALEHHVKVRHNTQFVCHRCGKSCSDANNLAKHERLHAPVRTFKCDKCEMSFSYRKDLLAHKSVHAAAKFQCHVCGVFFKREYDLKSHLTNHSPNAKLFTCPVCKKEYKEKRLFRKHVKRCAAPADGHGCDKCKTTWKDRRSKARHKCAGRVRKKQGI